MIGAFLVASTPSSTKAADYIPHWRDYERTVRRPIPLVVLERIDVQGRVGGGEAGFDSGG